MRWYDLSQRILNGGSADRTDALAILESPDSDLLTVLDGAFALRRRYFGLGVSIHVIRNAKSGLCSENCSFCSQAAVSDSDISVYPLQSVEELIEGGAGSQTAERRPLLHRDERKGSPGERP